jgi:predicted AAA+ superfamily ATPase
MGEDYEAALTDRWCRFALERALSRPFVHVLFGTTQTGKTTLLDRLLSHAPRTLQCRPAPAAVVGVVSA